MRRRQVIGGLAVAAAIAGGQRSEADTGHPTLKPRRLAPGDGVGIFSPAGATFRQADLAIVIDAVRGLGLTPKVAPHALDQYGYLAGQDGVRADDLNQFFADPELAALLPIRGDWGSARILPYLDYNLIRHNPKILVGFSDITALLLGIYAQTGLVTFHGPHGLTAWRPDQVAPLQRLLFEAAPLSYQNPAFTDDQDRLMQTQGRIQTIRAGQATGRLIGGNLSVISGIVGSPYLPDTTGAILFLEDVGEPPYRIDRMLTQLKLAGVLDGLAGFIFGQCTACEPGSGYGSLTLDAILQDHIFPLNIPAFAGAWIGHVEPLWTLPIGTLVTLDAAQGRLHMVEPAVL